MIGFGIRNPWRTRTTAVTFATLALLVVVTHAWVGYVAWSFYDAGSRIFVADTGADQTPAPTHSAGASSALVEDLPTPFATPTTTSARINILLTGIDSGGNREHALTDTMMVVSVDPTTNDVAMLSFPRDIANFPLYNGGTYRAKINSLTTFAKNHPNQFPDGPMVTLQKELGFLLGAQIHYYAAVDLDGFRRMIDVVGGVTVDNPRAINDPRYDWLDGTHGFTLSAGRHHLNGRTGLAYVRSRQGVGDSDFTRARRQQQVLVALRAKLTSPSMLPKLPAILRVAGDTIRTSFPSNRIDDMLTIASNVKDKAIFQAVLGPSKYAFHPPTNTTGGVYILQLKMDELAALSIKIFGSASAYSTATGTAPSAQPSTP
jgi:LCP family protein required for cell wall assembly